MCDLRPFTSITTPAATKSSMFFMTTSFPSDTIFNSCICSDIAHCRDNNQRDFTNQNDYKK